MSLEAFTPAMLKDANVPHYDDVNGKDIDSIRIRIKLFDRDSGWSWYIAAGCSKTGTCFGFEARPEGHQGTGIAYFQLKELNDINGSHGLKIRRSENWNPQTSLADVIEEKVR